MLRKIVTTILLTVFSLWSFNGNVEGLEIKDVEIFPDLDRRKPWHRAEFTYTDPIIPDEETAAMIASAIMKSIQCKGYAPNYELQRVFFDEEEEVWMVTFGEGFNTEDKVMTAGASCCIALAKSNAEVLSIWFGE